MIPIILLSLVAAYIFIERYYVIRRASREDTNFMNRIKDYIHDGKVDAAMALCKSTDSPSARMIEKGISRLGRPLQDISTAIENVGKLEISKLERGFPTLARLQVLSQCLFPWNSNRNGSIVLCYVAGRKQY